MIETDYYSTVVDNLGWGVQNRERGPNPLADLDLRRPRDASGFVPGNPSLGRERGGGGIQIR